MFNPLTLAEKLNRYRLVVEYDGSAFFGWQFQPNLRTVQGEIEAVLKRLFDSNIRINGAGRTDTGVHAYGQVVHFDAPDKFSVEILRKALNGNLSKEVRILQVQRVAENFHARFSAQWRWYRYRLFSQPRAIERNLGWYPQGNLSDAPLLVCAQSLQGEWDFTAFSGGEMISAGEPTPEASKRCRVFLAGWELRPAERVFHIVANRFLRHMVRRLIGGMVDVARGRLSLDYFQRLLRDCTPSHDILAAPPQGLYLMRVGYGPFPYLEVATDTEQTFPQLES